MSAIRPSDKISHTITVKDKVYYASDTKHQFKEDADEEAKWVKSRGGKAIVKKYSMFCYVVYGILSLDTLKKNPKRT